jgi:sortase A
MRRALRSLSTVLIVAGALLLADAVATLLWQEPVSAIYGRVQQGKLEDQLSAIEKAPVAAVDQRALRRLDASRRLTFAARSLARRSEPGDPLGKIRIPEIGLDEVFDEGTGTADLRRGPGH